MPSINVFSSLFYCHAILSSISLNCSMTFSSMRLPLSLCIAWQSLGVIRLNISKALSSPPSLNKSENLSDKYRLDMSLSENPLALQSSMKWSPRSILWAGIIGFSLCLCLSHPCLDKVMTGLSYSLLWDYCNNDVQCA